MSYISTERAVQHIADLQAAGMGTRSIAAAAKLGRMTIQQVPKVSRILVSTEAAILAVRPQPVVPGNRVDATGTRRRICAMLALGWSMAEQVRVAGLVDPSPWQRIPQQECVVPRTRELAQLVYDKLSMTVPTARSAEWVRAFARKHRYFPPLAWDDDTIDDPDVLPCILPPLEPMGRDVELAVQHLAAGHLIDVTTEARVEFVRRTRDWRAVKVAEHALCDVRSIQKIRKALDR